MIPETDKTGQSIYEELCIEQAESIETLSSQVRRLIDRLEQYTGIEDEEKKYKEIEERING